MNYLEKLLTNLKEIIKIQRKYTDENIIDLIFSKETLEPQGSEELYIHKFLHQLSNNLLKSDTYEKSLISNDEFKNQMPHFLVFLIITYKTLKEFLEKNKSLLEKIFDKSKSEFSKNNYFIDNLITSNFNIEELFIDKFLDYLKKAFLTFLNKDANKKISFLTFQELLRKDLISNYSDIFSNEEIQILTDNLILNIYESINLNVIENLDSDSDEDFEVDVEKEKFKFINNKNTFSSDLKFSIKSIKNFFDYLDLNYSNRNFNNEVKVFEGYLLEKNNNAEQLTDEINYEDLFSWEERNITEPINNSFLITSFSCLISDDFFDFVKRKNQYNNKFNDDDKNVNDNQKGIIYSLNLEDLGNKDIKEKLKLLSIFCDSLSIKLLITRIKVDSLVKNYFRRFGIHIIDRIPAYTYSEIKYLFEIGILSAKHFNDLEVLKESFLTDLNILHKNKSKNYEQNQIEAEIGWLDILNKHDLNNVDVNKYLILLNNINTYGNLKPTSYLKENYFVLGNINKKSKEAFLEELNRTQKFSEAKIFTNNREDLVNLIKKLINPHENNLDSNSIIMQIIADLMKEKLHREFFSNLHNTNKKYFLKYKPKTILINKFKGKLNEARVSSLNFILNKYSNLIFDKLNNEMKSEYNSKRFTDFKSYFFNSYSNKDNIINYNNLYLFIDYDEDKISKQVIDSIFKDLLSIILTIYEKNIVSHYSRRKPNNEVYVSLGILDKFLINELNINGIAHAIKFLFSN